MISLSSCKMTKRNSAWVFLTLSACRAPDSEADYLEERLSAFQDGTRAMAEVIKGNMRNGDFQEECGRVELGMNNDCESTWAYTMYKYYRLSNTSMLNFGTNLGFEYIVDIQPEGLTPAVFQVSENDIISTQCYNTSNSIECHIANITIVPFDDWVFGSDEELHYYFADPLYAPLVATKTPRSNNVPAFSDLMNAPPTTSITLDDTMLNMQGGFDISEIEQKMICDAPYSISVDEKGKCTIIERDQSQYITDDPVCKTMLEHEFNWLATKGKDNYLTP